MDTIWGSFFMSDSAISLVILFYTIKFKSSESPINFFMKYGICIRVISVLEINASRRLVLPDTGLCEVSFIYRFSVLRMIFGYRNERYLSYDLRLMCSGRIGDSLNIWQNRLPKDISCYPIELANVNASSPFWVPLRFRHVFRLLNLCHLHTN